MTIRTCFREPIPEIFEAAKMLQKALGYHKLGDYTEAKNIFQMADNENIKNWVKSIIGKKSPYIQYQKISESPNIVHKEERIPIRMPNKEEKRKIHERDGFQCRFCKIPVVRGEVREKIIKQYPDSVRWGKTNESRHAAFFAMWAQYDHILPHARGGDNSLENLVLTCSACNFGRMNYTLEEVGIMYPQEFTTTVIPGWNGLEEFTT